MNYVPKEENIRIERYLNRSFAETNINGDAVRQCRGGVYPHTPRV